MRKLSEFSEEFFELASDALIGEKIIFKIHDSELDYYFNNGQLILTEWSRKFGKEIVLKSSKREMSINLDIKIPVAYTGVAEDALIFTSYSPQAWSKPWLRTLEELENNERPSILSELFSGQQIWVNKAASNLLKLPPKELLAIKTFDTWLPGESEKLWSEFRGGRTQFDLEYRVKHASSGQLIDLKSDNKILELDNKLYRLSSVLEAQNV